MLIHKLGNLVMVLRELKNNDELDWIIEDKPNQLREAGVEDPFQLKKRRKKKKWHQNKKREKDLINIEF